MKKFILFMSFLILASFGYAATKDVVPRADSEGSVGDSGKAWNEGRFYNGYMLTKAGVGTTAIDSSAILELSATDKALLLTRVSDPANNIVTPVNGMLAYDTDDNQLQAYIGGVWTQLGAAGSGDAVTVNGTGADTTANFLDNTDIVWSLVDGGPGGPDDITGAVQDDSHAHTGTSLSGVDISDDTNLVAGTNITLTGDTLDVDDAFVSNTGDTMDGNLNMNDNSVTGIDTLAFTDSAGTVAGIQNQNLVDKTAVETVSGDWTHSGSLIISASGTLNFSSDICDGFANGGALTTDAGGNIICEDDDSGGGGGSSGYIVLYPGSAFITGTLATVGDATQGAQIDGSNGGVLLFDASTDEGAAWRFMLPDDWASHTDLKLIYSMASGTANEVEWEAAVMCQSDGDSERDDADGFAAIAVASETVPGTVFQPSSVTITLTDDSCAASDLMTLFVSTDADDGTNDDATGDRRLLGVVYEYGT